MMGRQETFIYNTAAWTEESPRTLKIHIDNIYEIIFSRVISIIYDIQKLQILVVDQYLQVRFIGAYYEISAMRE